MKQLITVVVLGMFSAAFIGCKASAEVDGDTPDRGTTSYKKTTTVKEPDGDKSTRTEVRTERTN